ncbi:uncharacterized protein LOC120439366 [Oreochromis aureus]|uniref:uncharacterized protein LOC120439366 n=1 Tax=Oreochromis aureus TaxID=47969 RepID=UPI0019533E95|nr:uncharacterized protein LOC120439366 [Oreochromis aureus]XP_039466223.1 uncharacterized protein LOC120439366 [Oreochromis aureus]
MIRILLFLSLASSVWTFVLKRTPTVFEAKEDDNITISLDSQLQADVSLADMMCVFHSDVTKILFKMIRGVENSESQDEQFAGRVQTDRDALRGGRIRLHLSRVTAEDSGSYRCDVSADYDNSLKRWRLETNENFVLSVGPTSDGDSSDVSLKPPMFGPPKGFASLYIKVRKIKVDKMKLSSAGDAEDPQLAGRRTNQEETVLFVLAVFLIIANAVTIVLSIKFLHDGLKRSTT